MLSLCPTGFCWTSPTSISDWYQNVFQHMPSYKVKEKNGVVPLPRPVKPFKYPDTSLRKLCTQRSTKPNNIERETMYKQ